MRRDLGIEAAGNRAGDAVGGWPGGVVAAAGGLAAAVVAGVRGLACRHVPAAVGGGLIVVLGKAVGLVQALLGVRGRALTEEEKRLLTAVYRDSVDLTAVRVVPGSAGVFGMNPRPFTLGGTIYLKNVTAPAVLVHECAHVWQYQHLGCRYTFDALWAQAFVKPSAYRWTDELGRGKTRWREFNREAQAQFLEDLVRYGRQVPATGEPGEFFTGEEVRFELAGVDHTALAEATVAEVRASH
jgi:hypothetical protein